MSDNGWIGVDLDGTLAEYNGWVSPTHIGKPVPKMLERVKQWLAEGRTVKILTARVSHDGTPFREMEASAAFDAITTWLHEHVGYQYNIPITNQKDYAMVELWDDRCVQVIPNTGERVDGKP